MGWNPGYLLNLFYFNYKENLEICFKFCGLLKIYPFIVAIQIFGKNVLKTLVLEIKDVTSERI
jgi:hypothetical protein